jgi:hypothetical protein
VRFVALALTLAFAPGCGAHPAAPRAGTERPVVQLVRCAPATPVPHLGQMHGAFDTAPLGLQLARYPVQPRRPTFVAVGPATDNTTALPGAKIVEIIGAVTDALATCWDDDDRATERSVQYRLTLRDGAVVAAEPRAAPSARGANPNDACLRRALAGLKFAGSARQGRVTVTLWFSSDHLPMPPKVADETTPLAATMPWTPYAVDAAAPGRGAAAVGHALESVVRARLPAIDACFTRPEPTGSERLVLAVAVSGEVGAVRSGGLGDAALDACITQAMAGARVMVLADEYLQIACDLARGNAEPWRVAPDAGYTVIRLGREPEAPRAPDGLPLGSYLVIAQVETPGAAVDHALARVGRSGGAMLALDGGDRRPPRFLAMAEGGAGPIDPGGASVRVGAQIVTACVRRTEHAAPVRDADAISRIAQDLARTCAGRSCQRATLAIGLEPAARVDALVEVVRAMRRAGFERALITTSSSVCPKGPAIEPPDPDEPAEDLP